MSYGIRFFVNGFIVLTVFSSGGWAQIGAGKATVKKDSARAIEDANFLADAREIENEIWTKAESNDLARIGFADRYKNGEIKKPPFPLFVEPPKGLSKKIEPVTYADENDTSPPPVNYKLARGEKEFAFEIGSSPFNPSSFNGPKEYDIHGRDYHNPNLRFGRVIGTKGPITYQYFFSFTPLAVFTKNEVKNPVYISEEATPDVPKTIRETTYGVGVQPLNFRFFFLPRNRWKPYAQVGVGILLTNKAIPVPRSKPFNLTGDFGGGLFYFTSRKRAVGIGYRYFHISNGNIGGKINNPGFNANIFSISYSMFYDR